MARNGATIMGAPIEMIEGEPLDITLGNFGYYNRRAKMYTFCPVPGPIAYIEHHKCDTLDIGKAKALQLANRYGKRVHWFKAENHIGDCWVAESDRGEE